MIYPFRYFANVCSSPTKSRRRITAGFTCDAVQGQERDSRCQSSKRDQGCILRSKRTSTGQEQRRMADGRYSSDTVNLPSGTKAAAEVAPSGRVKAEKVEDFEGASQ